MRNNICREDLDRVIELLSHDDPQLTSGPRVKDFEQRWSDWLGVKYSVFVNSGSSANLMALVWLKCKFPGGGKVIVPPLTWSSDISSIYWTGFEPLFVDITLNRLACNEEDLIDAFKKYEDIRALFITHAQGLNGLSQKIINECRERDICLIEDVCESHGLVLDCGAKAGSVGDLSCFSFYYAHHMSTIEGGMVCTNNKDTYQFLRMIRAHGMLRESTCRETVERVVSEHPDLNPQFIFTAPGFNFRNNEIGATIGCSQLERLDKMVRMRAKNFNIFLEGIPDWAFKDFYLKGQSNYAFNLILLEKDDDLMTRLQKVLRNSGIEYRRGSAGGGNQLRQPYIDVMFPGLAGLTPELMPIADHVHFYGMYIGNYPDLKESEIQSLCHTISSI